AGYENGASYRELINCEKHPVQDGMQIFEMIKSRMEKFQKANHCEPVINQNMTVMGINVFNFIPDCALQYDMFENNIQQHHFRKSKNKSFSCFIETGREGKNKFRRI